MWVCDVCLEVNDDEGVKCVKCGEARAPVRKLADEISESRAQPSEYGAAVAAYVPKTPLIIPSSTTVSPSVVRAGIIALALGWLILVGILCFSVANPPIVPPGPVAGATAQAAAQAEFMRDRQILRIFLVIILPLFVLFIPSTHWEFNPVSGLLIRSRGNLISRVEDGVWDMASIDKVHVGEIAATGVNRVDADPDGFDVLMTIQIVFKNEETLNIGPELRDEKWVESKVNQINRFLHMWQRKL